MVNANLDQFARAIGCGKRSKYEGGTILRGGGATSAPQVERYLPFGFHEVPAWRDGYFRAAFISERDRAIVTYCEGDVTIERYPDEATYHAAFERHNEYYLAH